MKPIVVTQTLVNGNNLLSGAAACLKALWKHQRTGQGPLQDRLPPAALRVLDAQLCLLLHTKTAELTKPDGGRRFSLE